MGKDTMDLSGKTDPLIFLGIQTCLGSGFSRGVLSGLSAGDYIMVWF